MNDTIKNILRPLIPQPIFNKLYIKKEKMKYNAWKEQGCPAPPPHLVKQNTIGEYQKQSGYKTLVETGTFRGDMLEAQKRRFDKLISIELSEKLHKQAQRRFRNDKHISIVQGDSGKMLPVVLKEIKEPAIFWLDGHYSSGVTAQGDLDCPIYDELNSIFNGSPFNHILLIDDARDFNGTNDYPTIEELRNFIKTKNEKYQLEVKHDIIRVTL